MIISEDEFNEQFLPEDDTFETYGKDLKHVLKQPPNKV